MITPTQNLGHQYFVLKSGFAWEWWILWGLEKPFRVQKHLKFPENPFLGIDINSVYNIFKELNLVPGELRLMELKKPDLVGK